MRKLLLTILIILFFSSPVFADMGIPLEVFYYPVQQCLLFVIFVLIEGLVYSKMLRLAFVVSIKSSFKANLISTLAGFPLAFVRAMIINSSDYTLYQFDKFIYYIPELLVTLVITYLIEFAVVKKTFLAFSKNVNQIIKAVFLANLITYFILGAVVFHHVTFAKPTLVNFSPSTFPVNIQGPRFYVYDNALYFNENGQFKGKGQVRVFTGSLNPNYTYVAPDGRKIIIESVGHVYVLDSSKHQVILPDNFAVGTYGGDKQWSLDSKRVLLKRKDSDSVWLYDTITEELREVLPDAQSWFYWGNDGQSIYYHVFGAGNASGKIKRLNLLTGKFSTYLDSFDESRPNPDIFVNFDSISRCHTKKLKTIPNALIRFKEGTTQNWIFGSSQDMQEIESGRHIIVPVVSKQFKGKILIDSTSNKYMIVPTDLVFLFNSNSQADGSYISSEENIYCGGLP